MDRFELTAKVYRYLVALAAIALVCALLRAAGVTAEDVRAIIEVFAGGRATPPAPLSPGSP